MKDSSELNLSEISAILKKRFVLFSILFCAVFFSTIIITLIIPPVYKASAKMIVQNENNLYPSGLMPVTTEDKTFLNTQREIMSSSTIVKNALEDLKGEGILKSVDYDSLKNKIAVDYIKDSNILEVGAFLHNSRDAVKLVNAMAKAFLDYQSNSKGELVDKSMEVLDANLRSLNKDAEDLKTKLKEFADKEKVNFYQAKIPYYVNNILELDRSNLSAQTDINRMKSELIKTNGALNSTGSYFFYPGLFNRSGQNAENPTASLATVPWMQDLKKRLSEAQVHLSQLSAEYSENHPEVIGARNEINSLQNSLGEELKNVLSAYSSHYEGYIRFLESQKEVNETEKAKLESELEGVSQNMDQAASRQIEYNTLLRKYDIMQDIYAVFLKKQSELQLLRAQYSNNAASSLRIFELAALPLKPVSPNIPLNLAIGICLGLFLGISGSLFEEGKATGARRPLFSGQERRSMARQEKSFVVTYEVKGRPDVKKEHVITENVSGSGMNIRVKEYLPKGSELSMVININNTDVARMTGEVSWVVPSKISGMFDLGVRFVDAVPSEREKIINYLYGEHYLSRNS